LVCVREGTGRRIVARQTSVEGGEIRVRSLADPSIGTDVQFSDEKWHICPADKGTAGRLHSAKRVAWAWQQMARVSTLRA
jgi:hypothetical protein